jgi:CSLREA domain-containing protein
MLIIRLNPRVLKVLLNLAVLLTLLVGSAGFPARAHALGALIIVDSTSDNATHNSFCTLREAIINANADSSTYSECEAGLGNDTITFDGGLANGTITLGSTLPTITDADGLTILGLPYISGGGFGLTISGNNLYEIFYSTAPLVLDTMIIKNGAYNFGGGVQNSSTLTITNSIFSGNNATIFGGAVYSGGTLNISDSTFSGNGAANVGSAVYNYLGMTATITNSTFSGNTNTAVLNNGVMNINGSTFTSNSGSYGAVRNDDSLTITSSTFSGNTGTNGAGVNSSGAFLSITKSTFYNNSTNGNGGGVLAHDISATISNTTFSNNSAGFGGGVASQGIMVTIVNSTFTNNSAATSGAGVYSDGTVNLYNTLLANSVLGSDCFKNSGSISGDHNLIETDGAGSNACATTSPISSDPKLGAMTGSPAYFPLKPGSPAIEGGNNTTCNAAPVSGLDQRGVVRPQGASCDIGAYEFVPTFVDVPPSHPYWLDIEILYANGLTAGCSVTPLNFCPDQIMDRAQSAVFNLRGNFGVSYTPPLAPWDRFADDWSAGAWAERWAEGLYNAGLTAGCATGPLRYCPWDQTPRVQAAVFGLRLKYGNSYVPPAATGTVFFDMTDTAYFGTKWAEQAYADGLLPNCGIDIGSGKPLFCPNDLVSRGFGSYMIVRAKNLTIP